MIVKMKHLDLVSLAAERDTTLSALRELGAVHLDLGSAAGAEVAAAKGEAADAEKAVRLILKARESLDYAETLAPVAMTVQEALALAEKIEAAKAKAGDVEREVKKYAPYGDFDPELARKLIAAGVDFKSLEGVELPEELPSRRLSAMEAELANVNGEIAGDTARLAAADEAMIVSRFPMLADKVAFTAAKELLAAHGALAAVSGWVPVTKTAAVSDAAKANGWGVLLRDPAEGETPPTLVEPPKLFRPMTALFAGIGIAPGYTEADVSVPFMCYFTLFFAMLVGDGAYGAIFLAATLFGWFKAGKSKAARPWLILLTVFSLATVAWGVLSNTWFGAAIPYCADWPTVKWLGDATYQNMMFLCFTIGASHLVLARVWNGICLAPDSTSLAQFGWAGIIVFMYYVVNSIVGIFTGIPTWAFWMFGVSLVAVFGFSVKPSELKTRGAELGMLPLNIMSALGDIISYVRLFAVGLASVKVAQNFNDMAVGLDLPMYLKVVPMVLILLVGHGLNLAMAMLSILVHAVRLNTLEFSNHKGVSWSGYAFRAFARNAS